MFDESLVKGFPITFKSFESMIDILERMVTFYFAS